MSWWGRCGGGRWAKKASTCAIDQVSPTELSARLKPPDHQGIAAVVDPYPYLDSGDLLKNHTLLIALDEVQDPQNLGAIIRTAEGGGRGTDTWHRSAEVTGSVVKASPEQPNMPPSPWCAIFPDFLNEARPRPASGCTAQTLRPKSAGAGLHLSHLLRPRL